MKNDTKTTMATESKAQWEIQQEKKAEFRKECEARFGADYSEYASIQLTETAVCVGAVRGRYPGARELHNVIDAKRWPIGKKGINWPKIEEHVQRVIRFEKKQEKKGKATKTTQDRLNGLRPSMQIERYSPVLKCISPTHARLTVDIPVESVAPAIDALRALGIEIK